ncbi:MAG: SOS response-associated peptidase [Candidimonas sp.]|nr:MAG: SOS response-associated peptidase [Candidimonas sp.]TAM26802.1 MAG: SOS response-associated peptidase [Candidimonas sp.]TAM79273.1 MAG: SOS response-associated peptidase [Candidimonas sp.]
MCGRIKQSKSDAADYMETMRVNDYTILDAPDGPRYNVAPGSMPWTIHQLDNGKWAMQRLFWGYLPSWGKTGPAPNARLDKLLANSGFWRGTLQRRMIVPADGWYEWTGEKPNKQPWFIYPKDQSPILLAAVSGWAQGAESDGHHGFAIVTDDAAQDLLEIHPRRPMVLTPDTAREWLDPETTVDQAKEILSTPRPESAFVWHQVTRKMSNARYQGVDSSDPIG